MDQNLSRILITLEITNNGSADVTSVVPQTPVLQVDANTRFALSHSSSPRSYPVLRVGNTVSFRWQGRLSAGAVGISASASATTGGGTSVATALIDCGTVGASQPVPPTPGPSPNDTSEAAQCGACHDTPMMALVANTWRASAHASAAASAQGNANCATCHSPLQAGAGWQGVTCSACHPPESERSGGQSPIAIYDVVNGTHVPVAVWDADVLCTNCHTGQFAQTFQGYGLFMHKAGVRCIDCHMASDPNGAQPATHDLKVAANVPYSCGTYPGGCHARRSETWAARVIALEPVHPPRLGQ